VGVISVEVDLSRRRDRILLAVELDLESLSALAADYEAVRIPFAPAVLAQASEGIRI
jgi:hypothetical protein